MPRTTGSKNLPRSVRQLRITTHQGDELVFGLENKLADQLAEEIAELYSGADIAEVEMIGDKLERFRTKDDEKRKEREDERGRRIRQINEREVRFEKEVRPRITQATAVDYNAWLTGYMQKGGEPTHRRDRPLCDTFYVALADLEMMPLYGASSVSIIVPSGVTVSLENGRDAGHCNLYFMEDFSSLGFHGGKATVPVYSDTRLIEA